ncbi:LysR family transcriptional regulator [Desulfitobacterium sp.]|uniref:LysR family transcriptional regulator n=1 Tax=Desulfitobacterium sp. TaxID=49981 RepID=UPI002B1EE087|nr:LysR family transcriptional regulator [Desulfitobacterium sp.]MEA4902045.1 LysR family transcriptional regulator [Desulfitobacterium sp.]
MTMIQLAYYVEVVKQRNFTRAAEKLFVSQSTLSKAIRALENEFQAEFIERRAKDLLITEDGLAFYEYATKLLDYYHTQTQELEQQLRRAGGTLTLGLPPHRRDHLFFLSDLSISAGLPGNRLTDYGDHLQIDPGSGG